MTDAGHNGGPPHLPLTAKTRLECIRSILERKDISAAQKCIATMMVLQADREWSVQIKTDELQSAASAKDRETVFRATRKLDDLGVVSKASGRGQSGKFRVLPPRIVSAVVEAFDDLKSGREKADHSDAKWSGESRRHKRSAPTPQPVGFEPTTSDQSAETGREKADHSRAEVSNNIYNNNKHLENNIYISLPEKLAASAREGGTIEIGYGVLVNCETICHPSFEIALPAIELQTLRWNVPRDVIRSVAAGHAIEWASQIAAGKSPASVLPKNGPVAWIAKSLGYDHLNADVNEVRKSRARQSNRHVPRAEGESFDEINRKIIAELEGRK